MAVAKRSRLPNIKCMVDAIPALVSTQSVTMFEKHGVFTKTELESRAEIMYETYAKTVHIEGLTMIDMAKKQILPACLRYQSHVAESLINIKKATPDLDVSVQESLMRDIQHNVTDLYAAIGTLEESVHKAEKIKDVCKQSHFYYDVVSPAMRKLRAPADRLEMLVSKNNWPIPSYGDLIFDV